MDDAVEDSVSEGRLANHVMPGGDGHLARDHGGAAAVALLDDLHEVAPLRRSQPVGSPIVEDQKLGFGDGAEEPCEVAVAMSEFEVLEDAWQTLVDHCDAVATGSLCECAAEPCLAHAARAGDDQVAPVRDPFSGQQALEQRPVEAAPGAVVDVFRAGADVAQPGCPDTGLIALGLPAGFLAVGRKAKPLGMGQIGGSALGLQFGEGFGNAVEAQRLQAIIGWVLKH